MLKSLSAALAAVAVSLGLGGCPITTICSPGDPSCAATCTPGSTLPQCQTPVTTGSIALTWTVNGMPAATACAAANAASVRVSLDGAAPAQEACATGARTFTALPAGAHTVQADLLDAMGAVLNSFPSTPVTVTAGGTSTVAAGFTTSAAAATGGLKFTWTIGGQPASTGCPATAQVKLDSTAQPGAAVSQTFACGQGTAQLDGLAAGAYTFTASFLNGGNTTAVPNLAVMVTAGGVTEVPVIDLPTGGGGMATNGAAVLAWTLNNVQGGANCPPNSVMNVTAAGGPTMLAMPATAACNAGTLRIPDLAPGTYNFTLTLADPAHAGDSSATGQVLGVTIAAGQDAAVPPANVSCGFCGM